MKLRQGLIISCQATEDEPLFKYGVMGAMAYAAVCGGADGVRTSGVGDIAAVKKEVSVPIIGLIKKKYADSEVYITPSRAEIDALGGTECDVIALDATLRKRPNGEELADLVAYAKKKYPDKLLMADIADAADALNAQSLGFDYVSTTLRGYTAATKGIAIPDYKFIKKVCRLLKNTAVVAEGGIWERRQLEKVLRFNPYAVVIGTAVTRPGDITKRFSEVFSKADRKRRR